MFTMVSPEQAGISSEKVLHFLQFLEKYDFCTHSILMARGHQILAEGYYTPFHKDFKHRMYSVSKSFVGVAVGLAIEDGLLTLEDKFVDFFPEYLNEHSNDRLREMTIRDMLMMETAVTKSVYWFTSDTRDRCEVYFRKPAAKEPGMTWGYDSNGSYLLGVIVEKLTGKPFLEYLKERFLLKAGFSKDAYCLQCPGGHSFGDSGVMCSARDLLTFARFVMDGGVIDGVPYMDGAYLEEATARQSSGCHDREKFWQAYGYGYQIWKAPNDGFAFCGMGGQFAICDREKDFIFVITSDNQGESETVMLSLIYHELYSNIIEQLGEPLPENEMGRLELEQKLSHLELFHLHGHTESSLIPLINGKKYLLEANPMGITSVSFTFDGKSGRMIYENAQGCKQLPFGLGYNEFCKFPQEDCADMVGAVPVKGHKYDCAVSGEWTEERKLLLKVQIIDKYFANLCMEFSFEGSKISLIMNKNAESFLEEYQGYACGSLVEEIRNGTGRML